MALSLRHLPAGLAVTLLAVLGALLPFAAESRRVVEIDRIVAIVNEDVIVRSELTARMEEIRDRLERSGTSVPAEHVLAPRVLERLVMERIQLQLAAESGIRMDDDQINRSVADIAARNGLSLEEFRNLLEQDGYDFAGFREEIRDELLVSQVRRRFVTDRVTVSSRDVDDHLATVERQEGGRYEYRLSHILIAVPDGASPEELASSRDRARALIEELRNGLDFAEAALAHSDGQQALRGGDLGWRRASELPTLFADIVPDLSPGEVSEPIRSPSGFHLIRLTERRSSEIHFVTQTHARHILLRPNEILSAAGAEARLGQLRERIVNGDDFAELARSHSDDPGSAAMGGDLGWLSPGDSPPVFREVLDGLAESGISMPFETEFGWHIVQVVARRNYDGTEEIRRATAVRTIRERKVEEEMQTWLRQIRQEAYVEYRLGEE